MSGRGEVAFTDACTRPVGISVSRSCTKSEYAESLALAYQSLFDTNIMSRLQCQGAVSGRPQCLTALASELCRVGVVEALIVAELKELLQANG